MTLGLTIMILSSLRELKHFKEFYMISRSLVAWSHFPMFVVVDRTIVWRIFKGLSGKLSLILQFVRFQELFSYFILLFLSFVNISLLWLLLSVNHHVHPFQGNDPKPFSFKCFFFFTLIWNVTIENLKEAVLAQNGKVLSGLTLRVPSSIGWKCVVIDSRAKE